MLTHESYMARAIELAEQGRGSVSPNPMVGCVLVKDGEILVKAIIKNLEKLMLRLWLLEMPLKIH